MTTQPSHLTVVSDSDAHSAGFNVPTHEFAVALNASLAVLPTSAKKRDSDVYSRGIALVFDHLVPDYVSLLATDKYNLSSYTLPVTDREVAGNGDEHNCTFFGVLSVVDAKRILALISTLYSDQQYLRVAVAGNVLRLGRPDPSDNNFLEYSLDTFGDYAYHKLRLLIPQYSHSSTSGPRDIVLDPQRVAQLMKSIKFSNKLSTKGDAVEISLHAVNGSGYRAIFWPSNPHHVLVLVRLRPSTDVEADAERTAIYG